MIFIAEVNLCKKKSLKASFGPCTILVNSSIFFSASSVLSQAFSAAIWHRTEMWPSNIDCLCKSACCPKVNFNLLIQIQIWDSQCGWLSPKMILLHISASKLCLKMWFLCFLHQLPAPMLPPPSWALVPLETAKINSFLHEFLNFWTRYLIIATKKYLIKSYKIYKP